MRHMLFITFLILSLVSGGIAADLNLQQVIDRWTEAEGGRTAIEAVQSIQISLHIKEPKFEVDGVYAADRKMRMRVDIYADNKRVYTEAYDGEAGWQMGESGGAQDSKPDGTAALWHGIVKPGKIFGLHEQAELGNHLQLEGREIVDKVNYYVLLLTLKDGFSIRYYVNPSTWLIERSRDTRAFHPDLDASKQETESRSSDFRKVNGVTYAFKSQTVDLKTGNLLSEETIKEIKINPDLSAVQFQKP